MDTLAPLIANSVMDLDELPKPEIPSTNLITKRKSNGGEELEYKNDTGDMCDSVEDEEFDIVSTGNVRPVL